MSLRNSPTETGSEQNSQRSKMIAPPTRNFLIAPAPPRLTPQPAHVASQSVKVIPLPHNSLDYLPCYNQPSGAYAIHDHHEPNYNQAARVNQQHNSGSQQSHAASQISAQFSVPGMSAVTVSGSAPSQSARVQQTA